MEGKLSVREHLKNEVFEGQNYSYHSIIKYIKQYRCDVNGKFDQEVAKEQYIDLVISVWSVLKTNSELD